VDICEREMWYLQRKTLWIALDLEDERTVTLKVRFGVDDAHVAERGGVDHADMGFGNSHNQPENSEEDDDESLFERHSFCGLGNESRG
jgi:hypothetical protein